MTESYNDTKLMFAYVIIRPISNTVNKTVDLPPSSYTSATVNGTNNRNYYYAYYSSVKQCEGTLTLAATTIIISLKHIIIISIGII